MSRLEEILNRTPLVADGGMGWILARTLEPRGRFICPAAANLPGVGDPALVDSLHMEYLKAGARLLTTNTFEANRLRLSRLGLADQVERINTEGARLAWLARDRFGKEAVVAGSMGPFLPVGHSQDRALLREVVEEQARGLLAGGIDCFICETYSDLEELVEVVGILRQNSDLPIIAEMTFLEEGSTLLGITPEEAVRILADSGALAIGVNCSVGPAPTLQVLARMAAAAPAPGLRLCAMPNAGLPVHRHLRTIYPDASPDYFGQFARDALALGASIIGGCCGTTPRHIQAIAEAMAASRRDRRPPLIEVDEIPLGDQEKVKEASQERSLFARKLEEGSFITCIQIDPPEGVSCELLLDAARAIKESPYQVEAVDVNDGSRCKSTLDSLTISGEIERRVGLETVPHLTSRDSGITGLESRLKTAHAVYGLRNLLAITGDAPLVGDYPEMKGVFRLDSVGLVRLVNRMNQGLTWTGKAFGGRTNYFVGVALDQTAKTRKHDGMDEEMDKLEAKIEAGACYAFTQPVFDLRLWEDLLAEMERRKIQIPLLAGIFPLASAGLARYLHNEVPGFYIPQSVQQTMAEAGGRARQAGFQVALEMLRGIRPRAAGIYIIAPFKQPRNVLDFLAWLDSEGEPVKKCPA